MHNWTLKKVVMNHSARHENLIVARRAAKLLDSSSSSCCTDASALVLYDNASVVFVLGNSCTFETCSWLWSEPASSSSRPISDATADGTGAAPSRSCSMVMLLNQNGMGEFSGKIPDFEFRFLTKFRPIFDKEFPKFD